MEKAITALQAKLTGDFQTFLSPYGIEAPTDAKLGDVDLTKTRKKVTAFVLPDDEAFEAQTIEADEIEQSLSVYLFMRGKTKEQLTLDSIRAIRAFRDMLRADNTLGGEVGWIHLEKASYLHGVGEDDNIKGIELTVKVVTEE